MPTTQRREIADGALRIGVAEEGSGRAIHLRGELDLANADALAAELDAAMAAAARVTIDMRQLEFIDSTGIALLVGAMSEAGEGTRLSFVPSEFIAVRRVLSLTGVAERMQSA